MKKILITNTAFINYAGTELYVKELSLELHNMGFQVQIYSPMLGAIAKDVMDKGIFVTSQLDELQTPDIIHAHHYKPTLDVLNKFPDTQTIFFCHSKTVEEEKPPIHASIKKYVSVDYFCLERIEKAGLRNTDVIFNWVNTSRFNQREVIKESPKKALMFTNYSTHNSTNYRVLKSACDKLDIELEGIGHGFNRSVSNPEDVLSEYDIVFAKAKCAMEAMATGAFVILCDHTRFGGAVMPDNVNEFRKYNFGFKLMNTKYNEKFIAKEINKYNHIAIKEVSDFIRYDADFNRTIDKIVFLYQSILMKNIVL